MEALICNITQTYLTVKRILPEKEINHDGLRVVVLGAGFGGLEVSSILSGALPDRLDLTLIDKNDSFFFGLSKLNVMFGRKTSEAVRFAYSAILVRASGFELLGYNFVCVLNGAAHPT